MWTRRLAVSSAPAHRRPIEPTRPAPRRRRHPGLDTRSLSASAANQPVTDGGANAAPQTSDSAAPILHLRGVGRPFRGPRAGADVTLAAKPGERPSIPSPNGTRKANLFSVDSGECPPSKGRIEPI